MSLALLAAVASGAAEPTGLAHWQENRRRVLADPSLVAYYDLQEGGGETLRNHSPLGTALDGTLHGPAWTDGRWPGKGALRFDGQDDYVEVLHHPALFTQDPDAGGSGELTIAAWVCSEWTHEGGLVDKSSEGWGKGTPFLLWVNHANCVAAGIGDGAAGIGVRDGVELARNQWVFLAFTVDDAKLTLYKDGMAVGSCARTLRARDNGRPLLIGCMKPGAFHYQGRIDEIAIFRRALPEAEVRSLYQSRPVFKFTIP
jgi:hypothetical protein